MKNKCPTCGSIIEEKIKLNDFQKEVKKLWEENKEFGLIIEAPRQIGKTTILLELAKEYSRIKPVVILCRTMSETYHIRKLLREFDLSHPDAEIYISTSQSFIHRDNCFIFYDEVEGNADKDTLRIYTPEKKKYIFGKEWISDEALDGMNLLNYERLRQSMPHYYFNKDIETNIWSKR